MSSFKANAFFSSLVLPFFSLFFLLATNHWYGWDKAKSELQIHDIDTSYQKIIESAPDLPKDKIEFHHAQRLIPLYVVGVLSKFTNVPFPIWFRVISLLLCASSIFFLWILLQHLQVAPTWRNLTLALWILHPYSLRYYLAAPGMLPDLVFIVGLALICVGLVKNISILIYLGAAAAICGRQTALLVLPAIFVWSLLKNKNRVVPFIASIIVAGIYWLTGKLAGPISLPSQSSQAVLGLWNWLQSDFSIHALGEHFLRIGIVHLLPLAFSLPLVMRFPRQAWEIILFYFLVVCIVAQPWLAGPVVAGGNAGRLSALAIFPALVAVSFAGQKWQNVMGELPGWLYILAYPVLFLLSLHHAYSWLGFPASAGEFVGMQAVGALLIFWVLILVTRRPAAITA